MIDLHIHLGNGYPIRIGPWRDWDLRELLRGWPGAPWAMVVDRDAWRFWADDVLSAFGAARIEPRILELPGGELTKTHAALMEIYGHLQGLNVGRDGTLAVFGGGVLGDLAGFAAATWMHGIRFVHLPTTLHSQVDSSIGGTPSLNYGEQRNLIGGTHQPSAVLISPEWLNSQDPRELRAGLAEVVKSGVIGDSRLLTILEGEHPATISRSSVLEEIIARALRVKAAVLEGESDVPGSRGLLEFGHKVGHAVETATGFTRFLHGEAVALGMVAELCMSRSASELSEAEALRVEELLERLGLPIRTNGVEPDTVLSLLNPDLWNRAAGNGWVLTGRLGSAVVVPDVPVDSVREGVNRILV